MARYPNFSMLPKAMQYDVIQKGGHFKGRIGLCIGHYPGGELRIMWITHTGEKIFRRILPKNVERI